MKYLFTFIFITSFAFLSFGQNIIFIALNADDDDGFAFLVLETISHPSTIVFDDGDGGTVTLTTTADITAGTIVDITDSSGAIATTHGSVSGFLNANADGEGVSADLTSPMAQQLALITTDDSKSILPGTYPNVVNHTASGDEDVLVYTGATTCTTPAACVTAIQNTANWATNDGTGSQTSDVDGNGNSYATLVGNLSFSALPIILTSFTATKKTTTTLLQWQTATEINNDYIVIERSTDGRTFAAIGQVQGAGTSYELNNYSFVDEKPKTGINYYRLRQVDYDGRAQIHKIVSVVFGENGGMVQVYPTEVASELNVVFTKTAATETQLVIVDVTGKEWLRTTLAVGQSQYTLDVSSLMAGQFFLQVQNAASVEVARFVKL